MCVYMYTHVQKKYICIYTSRCHIYMPHFSHVLGLPDIDPQRAPTADSDTLTSRWCSVQRGLRIKVRSSAMYPRAAAAVADIPLKGPTAPLGGVRACVRACVRVCMCICI